MHDLNNLQRSIKLKHSVRIDASPQQVFNFLKELDRNYLKLSTDHISCEIQNAGGLTQDAIMICEEQAGNQYVKHFYRVLEFTENKRLLLFSEKSLGKVHHHEFSNSTYVLQELKELEQHYTQVTTHVFIQFPNLIIKLLAIVSGTKRIWGKHLLLETEGLKTQVELEETVLPISKKMQ